MRRLVEGDITRVAADALVNAANSGLRGGGGVDGAIHPAGGPSIMRECQGIGGCPTGSAVITSAGDLMARYVIHAVAPVWHGGCSGEPELLASAYHRSFELAAEHEVASIALPSLGTGAYGYPLDKAAPIALQVASEHLRSGRPPLEVTFVLWGSAAIRTYENALSRLADKVTPA
ncbi:MAG: macro domain-containing protein [Chloroflexota bacterium]|nr:macro domain-containing protein [Chloroflexota bacterium]